MKKCPSCQRTFDDAMRFCQTDGTPLIEMSGNEAEDPYKTTVGRKDDLASALPPDPFQTIVSGFPKKDQSNEPSHLSEDQDSLKTMFITDEEMKRELSGNESKKESIIEVPPLVDDDSSSANKGNFSYDSQHSPNFNEPSLNPPSFGDMSSGAQSSDNSAFGDKPNSLSGPSEYNQNQNSDNPSSPFDDSPFNRPSPRIPSPFSDSESASFDQPSTPLPDYKEPEPSNYNRNDPFSSFGQSSPAGNQPLQQSEWTPPPAPELSWQNQEIGTNTPFQPPAAGTGQNQTLAIVSLVLGIIGIVLCQLTAPAALITGFMARKKAAQNPYEYGGSGLALAGIIMGAIGTLLLVFVIIYLIIVFGIVMNQAL